MHRRAFAASLAALTVGLRTRSRGSAQPATPAADSPFRAVEVDGTPIALSPDGTAIAGLTPRHSIAIWDAATLEPRIETDPVDEFRIIDHRSLTWSPDGTTLAFSLDGLRLMLDSDIYTVDATTGQVANLTDEAATEEPAASVLDATTDTPLHMDLFPSWSPDSAHIAFTRSSSPTTGDDRPTDLFTIPREGGEPHHLATVSTDMPYLISGPMTWLDDGSILYATWPPRPDSDSGLFLAMPDGSIEIVSTGLLAASMPSPLLVDVNVEAGLASVVSSTNLARGMGDPEADITFLVDLRTGIPTPIREILPLPKQKGSSPDDYVFIAPPAITVEDGRTLLTYALVGSEASEVWRYDLEAGEAILLGALPPPAADVATRAYYPSVDIAANGAMFVTAWNGTWISAAS